MYIETHTAPDGFRAEIHQVKDIWDAPCFAAQHPDTKETLFGGMYFATIDTIKKAIDQ